MFPVGGAIVLVPSKKQLSKTVQVLFAIYPGWQLAW